MSAAATAGRRLAALVSGLGAATLVVAGVALGASPAGDASARAGAAVDVPVPVSGSSRTCPGAPVAAVGDGTSGRGRAGTASATTGLVVAGVTLTATALRERRTDGSASTDGTPGSSGATEGAALGDVLRVSADGTATASGTATALRAGPVAGGAPLLAGATTSVATGGDLRGLATAACVTPAEETWLVGGSTGVGRSTRLLLAGTESATTVDVTVLTADGPQQPSALQGLSLGAGEQRSVLLEGVLDGVTGPAAAGSPLTVGVRSSAGPVAAWLVEGVLRGLVPGGQEVVAPAAAPATSLLVPGVVTVGATPAALRVANPGDVPVVARFSVVDGTGSSVPSGATPAAAVPAGSVVDVDLPGLPGGGVALAVDADGPLLAAARTDSAQPSTGKPIAGDFAWTAAAEPLAGPVLVALPPGTGRAGAAGAVPDARLVLTSGDAAAAVDVAIVGADGRTGAARRVELPATTTAAAAVAELVAAAGGVGTPVALLLAPVPEPAGDPDGESRGVVAALTARLTVGGGGDLVSASPVVPGPQVHSSVPVVVTDP